MIAAFVCTPINSTRLTPRACGRRFGVVQRARAGRLAAGETALVSPSCVGCAVGEAHARGELLERWPDGSPIVRLELSAPAPSIAPPKRRAFVVQAAPRKRRRSKGGA